MTIAPLCRLGPGATALETLASPAHGMLAGVHSHPGPFPRAPWTAGNTPLTGEARQRWAAEGDQRGRAGKTENPLMSTGGEKVPRSLGLGPLACGCHMQLVKVVNMHPHSSLHRIPGCK